MGDRCEEGAIDMPCLYWFLSMLQVVMVMNGYLANLGFCFQLLVQFNLMGYDCPKVSERDAFLFHGSPVFV